MTSAPSLDAFPSASNLSTATYVDTALSQADQPQSFKQILAAVPQGIRPTEEELRTCLDVEIEAGRVHKFPEVRGQICYWNRSQADFAKLAIVNGLQHSLSKADIVRKVSGLTLMKGFPKTAVGRLLDHLVEAGTILKLPSYLGGRTPRFCARELDPRDYVGDAFQKLAKKLGIDTIELYRHARQALLEIDTVPVPVESASNTTDPKVDLRSRQLLDGVETHDSDLGDRLIQAMRDVNPRVDDGDMVSISELRKRLDFQIDKRSFDRQLIQLAERSRVSLHPFDQPGMTAAEELEQFVVDDAGQYFNTVSLRRTP